MFCERLEGLTHSHARSTADLTETHRAIGLALGGEPGARLAEKLSLPTSPDTLLRRVKESAEAPYAPPRYVGIDDWAYRKGQSYGTILIDLERRRVIDILPGRDGEALKQWLAAHPQIEVITRDRWPAYIEAATTAAPQAKQVADRFHLLGNVREAVEKLLTRYGAEIRAASLAVDSASSPPSEVATSASSSPESTPPDTAHLEEPKVETHDPRTAKQRLREERFQQVKSLATQGHSIRSIARQLGIDVKVVRQYLQLDRCPDWCAGRSLPSSLDRFAQEIAAWIAAGNRNAAELYRLLKTQGYAGGYDAVRRYLSHRLDPHAPPLRNLRVISPGRKPAPSMRKLSFRILNPKADSHSSCILHRLRAQDSQLHATLNHVEELMAMIRQQNSTSLEDWCQKSAASVEAVLQNIATSILKDSSAVKFAMQESWSNGPVEGHVNRLKTIKRQMYGRAGMRLLKARVRHKEKIYKMKQEPQRQNHVGKGLHQMCGRTCGNRH